MSLLDLISSPPTKSLLKQWANPVEITSEKVVISINSENLLKQFVEGNKRNVLVQAVNNLFNQENSNVLVRLPQPEDKIIKEKASAPKPKAAPPPPTTNIEKAEKIPTDEEIQESREEVEVKLSANIPSMHSDMVNMVVELFDGKLID